MKVGLITGGRWHNEPYLYLKKRGIEVILFDDSENCFIKKKYNHKNHKLKNIKNFKNISFWSPCNDFGSVLSDYFNKVNQTKTKLRSIKSSSKSFDKKKFSKLSNKSIKFKYRKYLLKPRFGSGSSDIKFWNGKIFNKKKFYLEEYFRGFELSVEVISNANKHKIFAVSLRIVKKIKSAIALLSFDHSKKFKIFIQDVIENHLNKHKVANGVSHIELILNNKLEVKIIDTNLRCPGAGLTEYFYFLLTNKNLFEIDFKILFQLSKKLTSANNSKNGIILFDHSFLNNFKKKLSSLSKNLVYYNLTTQLKANKLDNELDINRKGLAVKSFKSKKELVFFCEKIFKKKDLSKISNFFNFHNENFS